MKHRQTQFSLLLVDDEPELISLLKNIFSNEGYAIYTALNGYDALAAMTKIRIDAALIDLRMPEMDGLTLLKEMKKLHPEIMVIMLTSYGDIQIAVNAIKQGAVDFLEKPLSYNGLPSRVRQLYKIWELKEENRKLREKIAFRFGFEQLVGNSRSMLKLKETIAQIGRSDATVLVQGETGTGKELVSRAIHDHSFRRKNRFVPVDCAAISESVMEGELFGHVKGAFTGAYTSNLGLIRMADKGTLFLDEIGELPQHIQAKLLRTIQEKEVRPVGGNLRHSVDVRILAATNRDLGREVQKGTFRKDLFYRLNVLRVVAPPMRHRKDDLSLLANYFLKRFQTESSPVKEISIEALKCFDGYHWPGNVRELENVVRRAVALGRNETIMPDDLPEAIYCAPGKKPQDITQPFGNTLADYEMAAILNALKKSGKNRKKAAEILKIGEATLYRKLKKFRIDSL